MAAPKTSSKSTSDPRLKKLEEAVFGNGQPGLKTEVALIKQDMGEVKWGNRLLIGGALAFILERLLSLI